MCKMKKHNIFMLLKIKWIQKIILVFVLFTLNHNIINDKAIETRLPTFIK